MRIKLTVDGVTNEYLAGAADYEEYAAITEECDPLSATWAYIDHARQTGVSAGVDCLPGRDL